MLTFHVHGRLAKPLYCRGFPMLECKPQWIQHKTIIAMDKKGVLVTIQGKLAMRMHPVSVKTQQRD